MWRIIIINVSSKLSDKILIYKFNIFKRKQKIKLCEISRKIEIITIVICEESKILEIKKKILISNKSVNMLTNKIIGS